MSAYAEGRDQCECDAGYSGFGVLAGGHGLYLPCSMNGGASGGPWLRFYRPAWFATPKPEMRNPGSMG